MILFLPCGCVRVGDSLAFDLLGREALALDASLCREGHDVPTEDLRLEPITGTIEATEPLL